MNPYDFVPIDWQHPPKRKEPTWHHKFGATLYSGSLEVAIEALTPLFIPQPQGPWKNTHNHTSSQLKEFIHRDISKEEKTYIIPGSSLKGMLCSVVETLGNGCLTIFGGEYEIGTDNKVDYTRKVYPKLFLHCECCEKLCIACRIFGMFKEKAKENHVFLGKVNISDAESDPEHAYLYKLIWTKLLMNPKPHHSSFYLDESGHRIAGRKFYFHQEKPQTANGPLYLDGKIANSYIQPLDKGTKFCFRIDFTNLEPDELGALLLAITLDTNTRHKIGYAKPLGLGSIQLNLTKLTLIDYQARYLQMAQNRGKTIFEGDSLRQFCDELINQFQQNTFVPSAMQHLQRIWRWPPDSTVEYNYPSYDWFKKAGNAGKRIVETRDASG